MANVLFAGPYYGEFGWELFSWQAYVRKKAKRYSEIIVATSKGSEALYTDITSNIVVHEIPRISEFWRYKQIDVDAKTKFERQVIPAGAEILKPGYYKIEDQEFIRFGNPNADVPHINILFHARGKSLSGGTNPQYDWPIERWEVLSKLVRNSSELRDLLTITHENPASVPVGQIGLPSASFKIPGVEDYRGYDLQRTMDIIRRADLVIGPSSGAIHLASLCGTPHIVWTDKSRRGVIETTNRVRYEVLWNPFHTPVRVIDEENWNPRPETVFRHIVDFIRSYKSSDKTMSTAFEYSAEWYSAHDIPDIVNRTYRDVMAEWRNKPHYQWWSHMTKKIDNRLRFVKRALEIGCQWGKTMFWLCDWYSNIKEYIGIDFSNSAIAWCKQNNPHPDRCKFIQMDIRNWRSKQLGKFDLITIVNTIEQTPPEVAREIAACAVSLISPNGMILVRVTRKPDIKRINIMTDHQIARLFPGFRMMRLGDDFLLFDAQFASMAVEHTSFRSWLERRLQMMPHNTLIVGMKLANSLLQSVGDLLLNKSTVLAVDTNLSDDRDNQQICRKLRGLLVYNSYPLFDARTLAHIRAQLNNIDLLCIDAADEHVARLIYELRDNLRDSVAFIVHKKSELAKVHSMQANALVCVVDDEFRLLTEKSD